MKWTATHCSKGHAWVDSNTYLYLDAKGNTRRKCRACTLRNLATKRATSGIRVRLRAPTPQTADAESKECWRVNRLTELQEQLEAETRAWMRGDIESEILKLKAKR